MWNPLEWPSDIGFILDKNPSIVITVAVVVSDPDQIIFEQFFLLTTPLSLNSRGQGSVKEPLGVRVNKPY